MSEKSISSIDKLQSRRAALRVGVGSLIAGGLARVTRGAVLTTVTPVETQGPFWVDTRLNRSDVRTNTDTSTNSNRNSSITGNSDSPQLGFPIYLTVTVSKLANGVSTPLSGAYVDIWHANAYGNYSDEAAGQGNANTQGYNWLRGYQLTSSRGVVNFVTNWPGFYTGRTPHIHCRVRTFSGTTTTLNTTTQFFFDDTVSDYVFKNYAPYNTRTGLSSRTYNSTDGVYNTVSSGSTTSAPDGSRLLLRLQRGATYATASFNVVVA
ncbi:MAG TPA: hypothetical protein VM008_00975 [Phycisphaerae bacterium]|nr:hypothetical protein [Phycisphaerae bacterium]